MNLSKKIRSWFEHLIQRITHDFFSKEWPESFLLVVLFSTFAAVMICETTESEVISRLLGLSEENENNKIVTFLGIEAMGRISPWLCKTVIANMRAQAMVHATNAAN